MLGCGAFKGSTNHLQSVTLGASLVNGVPPTGQAGFFDLRGDGGTIQLMATANYTNGTAVLLHGSEVIYTVIIDPNHTMDAYGNALLPPCYGPCPQNGTQGTVEISPTGLVTAVEPATCTWVDPVPLPGTASWFFVGAYQVTVSYQGITSQPVYIPVASSAGDQFYPALINGQPDTDPANENNPSAACGQSSS